MFHTFFHTFLDDAAELVSNCDEDGSAAWSWSRALLALPIAIG
jgi:hypothetical protein